MDPWIGCFVAAAVWLSVVGATNSTVGLVLGDGLLVGLSVGAEEGKKLPKEDTL